jgi:hypothetical protein
MLGGSETLLQARFGTAYPPVRHRFEKAFFILFCVMPFYML